VVISMCEGGVTAEAGRSDTEWWQQVSGARHASPKCPIRYFSVVLLPADDLKSFVMAYDLIVGTSPQIKDSPIIVDGITFEETHALASLYKRYNTWVFADFMNQFDDQRWGMDLLEEGRRKLLELLPCELSENERRVIYKLVSVFTYALEADKPLHGVAD